MSNLNDVDLEIDFTVGDEVKWFDSTGEGLKIVYSMFPNYGKIVKLTPKFADVFEAAYERVVRVRKSELNWS